MRDVLAGEEDGCINVHSRSRELRARLLSALYNRPFQIGGQWFASLEGFYQGIKFPLDDIRRYQAFASCFGHAQSFSKLAEREYVWWAFETIPYASHRHLQIVEIGFRESFRQCPDRMEALCATAGLQIIHETGQADAPGGVMPSWKFCEFLTRIREEELTRRRDQG